LPGHGLNHPPPKNGKNKFKALRKKQHFLHLVIQSDLFGMVSENMTLSKVVVGGLQRLGMKRARRLNHLEIYSLL